MSKLHHALTYVGHTAFGWPCQDIITVFRPCQVAGNMDTQKFKRLNRLNESSVYKNWLTNVTIILKKVKRHRFTFLGIHIYIDMRGEYGIFPLHTNAYSQSHRTCKRGEPKVFKRLNRKARSVYHA